MRNRPIAWLAGFGLIAGLLAGCAAEAEESHGPVFPASIDAANGTVVVPTQPARIVSLSPTATEMLFEIGAGAQTIAVDDRSNHPDAAPRTTLSGLTPSIEAIIGYQPDLVVASSDTNGLVASLNATSVPVLIQPPATTLNDAYDQMIDLGVATGNEEHSLEVVDEMRDEIRIAVAETAERLGQGERPSYYHELNGNSPPATPVSANPASANPASATPVSATPASAAYLSATSASFVGSIYDQFGLDNIADNAPDSASGASSNLQLSAEYIISSNPDVIFLANSECCAQDLQSVSMRPGWADVAAVRNSSVVELDDDIASRWGPRVVEMIEQIGNALRTDHDRRMLAR